MANLTPEQTPPVEVVAALEGASSRPTETPPDEILAAETDQGTPTEEPLQVTEEIGAAAAAAWLSNKKITALWSINEIRNAWVSISGVGWRKLANNSDSGIVALTMLASHARQMDRIVNAYEKDNLITQMYVW